MLQTFSIGNPLNKGVKVKLVDKTTQPTYYSHVQSLVPDEVDTCMYILYITCFLKFLSEYSVVSFEKIASQ